MNNNEKHSWLLFGQFILVCCTILYIICIIDFSPIIKEQPFRKTLQNNLDIIEKTLRYVFPIIFTLVISAMLLTNNLIISVDRLSIGSMNILFKHPDKIFTQQMKNYLTTKRTLFKIDPEKDNFAETLDSYFDTYKFIREGLAIYPPKQAKDSDIYANTEALLANLNKFLTEHQNNYRRWYDYEIKNNSKANYNLDIGEIQSKYRNIKNLEEGFERINKDFRDYAEEYEINYKKWD